MWIKYKLLYSKFNELNSKLHHRKDLKHQRPKTMSPKTTASSSLPLKQNFTLMSRSFSINLNTRQHNPYVHKKNIFDVVISIIFFRNFTPTFHQFHLYLWLFGQHVFLGLTHYSTDTLIALSQPIQPLSHAEYPAGGSQVHNQMDALSSIPSPTNRLDNYPAKRKSE